MRRLFRLTGDFIMIIEATAPVALQLAGNGLDIYPIHVFEDGCMTLSLAMDLRSNIRLRSNGNDRRIRIYSEDLKVKCIAESLEDLPTSGPLRLIQRTLKFYSLPQGLDIVVRGGVSEDTGIASAPSVLMALSSALNQLTGSGYTQADMIKIGALLEMQSEERLTGRSPYYSSTYGGIQCVWFGMDSARLEKIEPDPVFLHELQESLTLASLGPSSPVGHTEWEILKHYMDRQEEAHRFIKENLKIVHSMRKAFIDQNLKEIANLMDEGCGNPRFRNAEETNPASKRIAEELRSAGAMALKTYGTGWAGCLLIMHPPGKKDAVRCVLANRQIPFLPFSLDTEGPRIRQSAN